MTTYGAFTPAGTFIPLPWPWPPDDRTHTAMVFDDGEELRVEWAVWQAQICLGVSFSLCPMALTTL